MKINEVEKLLGITKANIRFYEKEGLIFPARSENGYREYSEAHITQLKEIIILRKLGIPVQQIADILDGALPLQDALDSNIHALQEEIEKLNGSLLLCKQLKQEDARMLDTERYWQIIQEKEQQGLHFQSLLHDYIQYMGDILTKDGFIFWLWDVDWKKPKKVLQRLLGAAVLYICLYSFSYDLTIPKAILFTLRSFLFWTILIAVLHIPIFLIGRSHPKLAENIRYYGFLLYLILGIGLICYVVLVGSQSLPF